MFCAVFFAVFRAALFAVFSECCAVFFALLYFGHKLPVNLLKVTVLPHRISLVLPRYLGTKPLLLLA